MKLFWKTAAALVLGASAACADDSLPVFGTWDCGAVMGFTLDAETYTVNGRAGPVKGIEKIADDAFGVTLRDDYRFALFDVTAKSLTWHSPESGDTFECRRQK
jgi:hypothetical protein